MCEDSLEARILLLNAPPPKWPKWNIIEFLYIYLICEEVPLIFETT